MITGKTTSGFEYKLEEETLDDYELLECLCEIDDGNTSLIPKMATQLLGKEQKKALMEHLRNESGKISSVKMGEAIGEILSGCNQGKNS